MECIENKTDAKITTRRPKKLKNLEQEVELILSQDESDDDAQLNENMEEISAKTPSRNDKIKEMSTPRASQAAVLHDMLQTPRRSCRKSIKPTQEYDDIVNKSCNRANRSIKHNLMEEAEEEEENVEDHAVTAAQPKWTPAKVGRVSQKRGRKSRRKTKGKQNKENDKGEENAEENVVKKNGDDEAPEKKTESVNKLKELQDNAEFCEGITEETEFKDLEKYSENVVESHGTLQEIVEIDDDKIKFSENCKNSEILQNQLEKSSESCEVVSKSFESFEDISKSSETCKTSEILQNNCKKSSDICEDVSKSSENNKISDILIKDCKKSFEICEVVSKSSENNKPSEVLQNDCEKSFEIVEVISESSENNKISEPLKNDCEKLIEICEETAENISKSSEICKTIESLQDDIKIVENMEVLCQKETENDKKPEIVEYSFVNPTESLTEFMKLEEQMNNIQDHDESLHLIQEDSEDATDLPIKSVEKEKTQNPTKLENTQQINDSFGSYLKAKDINMADLGLNPLNDEAEDEAEVKYENIDLTNVSPETEEMPSLIVCEDDEEDKKLNDNFEANESVVVIEENSTKPAHKEVSEKVVEITANENSPKLNNTFDAEDSILVMEQDNWEPQTIAAQENMESLQLSDEEGETPKKAHRIIETNSELQTKILQLTPKISATKRQHQQTTPKLPSTPQQSATTKLPSTPKQSTKAFRFPTPYRNRQNFQFNKNQVKASAEKNPKKPLTNNSFMLSSSCVTTLEPKEIILRGIRKRSLSVCIDGNDEKRYKTLAKSKSKQDRIVSFYSPANQTTIIDDLDMIIAKSLKKQKKVANTEVSSEFVTTRRKRSLSMDESIMSTSALVLRLPRPVLSQNTPNKNQASSSKPFTRTKIPNFAAIHQKQIQQTENLVDYVNRKQERAKVLINSATKIRPASAQKNVSIKPKNNNERPKAIKKIDLGVSQVKKSSNTTLDSTISTAAGSVTNAKHLEHATKTVPDPYLRGNTKTLKTGVIQQRIPRTVKEGQENVANKNLPRPPKTGVTPQKVTQKAPQLQKPQIRKYLKPTQPSHNTTTTTATTSRLNNSVMPTSTVTKPKPIFNLSTSLMKPSSSTSNSMENLHKISNEDKMAQRLQRHMDLFKGRVPGTRAGVASRKNDAVIRGVRSNRRFELQMQHRKNMEN